MVFAAGQKLTAAQLNSACPLGESESSTDVTFGTTSSTSFTDTLSGTSAKTHAFTAPPSGSVAITIAGAAKNSTTAFSGTAFRLSGASTRAAVDDEQFFVQGTNEVNFAKEVIVTGLTAGGAYTVTMQHKVTSGASTGTFNYRQIKVRPLPA